MPTNPADWLGTPPKSASLVGGSKGWGGHPARPSVAPRERPWLRANPYRRRLGMVVRKTRRREDTRLGDAYRLGTGPHGGPADVRSSWGSYSSPSESKGRELSPHRQNENVTVTLWHWRPASVPPVPWPEPPHASLRTRALCPRACAPNAQPHRALASSGRKVRFLPPPLVPTAWHPYFRLVNNTFVA